MDTLLSFLFERSSDFFCVLDKHGFIRHTNPAFRKMLGYSAEELAKIKINALSDPADAKRRGDMIGTLIKKKQIKGFEARIKGIDGHFHNIEWSLHYDSSGDLFYASGTNFPGKLNGNVPWHLADNIQHILQSFNEGFFIVNNNWHITAFNPAFLAITGLNNKQLKNSNLKKIRGLGITPEVIDAFELAFESNTPAQVQYFNKFYKRWLLVNISPYKNEVMAFIRDINSVKIQQLILALEKKVLELNASGTFTLPQTINELLKGIEEIFPDMICSVLEVDNAQEKVYHLAAPRLKTEYCNLINGSAIGPKTGSCGTSVYHRSQIIVSNIETDPLWDDYREMARPFGLKACWSMPVIGSRGSHALATFAVYYTKTREPKPEELQLIERTSNILRVLIENKRNQESIKEQNKMLQEIASISSHEIRRPVATILGLVNLFDRNNPDNPMNQEIVDHLDITAQELDGVIHAIVERTIHLRDEL